MNKTFVIAEAGINHNGSVEIAKKLIDVAKEAGANAVKFQTFKAENVVSRNAPKAEYQKGTTKKDESHLEMVRKLELDKEAHITLRDYAKEKEIHFLSTPFDLESIDLLNDLGLQLFKIPSGEITNLPYLRKIGSLGKKIIMSSGMANMEEIKKALDVLVEAGTEKENIVVLQCNTEYPTPYEDANLLAMKGIQQACGCLVGFSDHTLGIEVPIAAAALGAVVVEKHFTLDQLMDGPDHHTSLDPEQFKTMVEAIRHIEQALGDGSKRPTLSEMKNIPVVRKSIVAAKDITKGEVFSEENLTVKRPGNGVSPMEWDEVIGAEAKRDFKEDELIEI